MSGCWNSTRPKRSSTKGKRASAGRSRRLKHSCIGTSATRTKAIDMTDDPGERQGDILSRHAATPRPPSQEFPMPTVFFPPRTRARVGGTPGRTAFHPDAALRHPVRRFAGCRRHRLPVPASAMPTRSGTGGFPIPSRLPCSWAVPASEWPRCSCAVHASWDSPSAFWPSQAISCWTQ